ncbi:unnamed protein product [Polarella glacialis]|uniref:RING-type domain-containing protein n=1 Tax=Polarella glacialis TaxID=89957 RepID=A0A813GFM2_POLGL|nr:unnamed protein product [Polarella glacialis]
MSGGPFPKSRSGLPLRRGPSVSRPELPLERQALEALPEPEFSVFDLDSNNLWRPTALGARGGLLRRDLPLATAATTQTTTTTAAGALGFSRPGHFGQGSLAAQRRQQPLEALPEPRLTAFDLSAEELHGPDEGEEYLLSGSARLSAPGLPMATALALLSRCAASLVEGGEGKASFEPGACCAVCLEELCCQAQSQVARLPCGHDFHRRCVLPWLLQKGSCPYCRACPLQQQQQQQQQQLQQEQ